MFISNPFAMGNAGEEYEPRYSEGGEGYQKSGGDVGAVEGWWERDWKACLSAIFLSIALRGDIG